jgi:hypothetical protein
LLAKETLGEKVTKESFLSMVDNASEGGDFLKILDLLPNSLQRYGHSFTMNAIVKILCHHPTSKIRCTGFYTMKMKGGKETKVVSTFSTLNQSNKELLRGIICERTPSHGPWFEVINILELCNEAFNESASLIARKGMPTNQIACVAHMLCDERFFACIILLTVTMEPGARPAELDQMKATGRTKSDAVYSDINEFYKTWVKDYKNPFLDRIFKDDLAAIQPSLALFKDGDAIRSLLKSTVQKVETILKNISKAGIILAVMRVYLRSRIISFPPRERMLTWASFMPS